MKSILQELYVGGIYPAEQIACKTRAYRALNNKLQLQMDGWRKTLSAGDYEKLEHMMDLCVESSDMMGFENFRYGFHLGARLVSEAFAGEMGRSPRANC